MPGYGVPVDGSSLADLRFRLGPAQPRPQLGPDARPRRSCCRRPWLLPSAGRPRPPASSPTSSCRRGQGAAATGRGGWCRRLRPAGALGATRGSPRRRAGVAHGVGGELADRQGGVVAQGLAPGASTTRRRARPGASAVGANSQCWRTSSGEGQASTWECSRQTASKASTSASSFSGWAG